MGSIFQRTSDGVEQTLRLPFEVRVQVGEQMRYAWRPRRSALVALARMTGTTRILRFALRSIPGALAEIDALLSSG